MKIIFLLILVCASSLVFGLDAYTGTPCDGLKNHVSSNNQKVLQISVSKQLNVDEVNLLNIFVSGNWRVLYVDTYQSDEVFLFYSDDPVKASFVSMWSGASMINEGAEIEEWALTNIPGIPKALASCFAWYATEGRSDPLWEK